MQVWTNFPWVRYWQNLSFKLVFPVIYLDLCYIKYGPNSSFEPFPPIFICAMPGLGRISVLNLFPLYLFVSWQVWAKFAFWNNFPCIYLCQVWTKFKFWTIFPCFYLCQVWITFQYITSFSCVSVSGLDQIPVLNYFPLHLSLRGLDQIQFLN